MVKLAPIVPFNQHRRREGSGEPTECQPATREELDAAPPTPQPPVLGTRTGTPPETPLLQLVQSLPEPEPPTMAFEYPAECQPAAREELCASPSALEPEPTPLTPMRGIRTVPLPETSLLQPAAVLAELSPVFDEVVSPQPAVVCVSASPRSRRLIVSGSTADLPSVRALPFTPVPEPVRLRRRWVPLWPLPPDEAEV